MYSVPKSIQIYILNILYEYDEIWSSPFYLVNKHFFTVVKSLVGSQLNFIMDSRKDEIKFQSFIDFITCTDRLYNKPYFIYEQLDILTICILERNKEQILLQKETDYNTTITNTTSKLLECKQWKEWNKELINSTRNHGIDVQVIDPYFYFGLHTFDTYLDSEQVTHLDISINLWDKRSLSSQPLPNLQTLNLTSVDDNQDSHYYYNIDIIKEIKDKCKQITKLGLELCSGFSIRKLIKYLNTLGGQLTRLEILGVGNNDIGELDPMEDLSSDFIHSLKKHSNIKEFGISYTYYRYIYDNLLPRMVDYLFSEECHIDTITQLSLYSDLIPPIKRRIPYIVVSLFMVTDYDKESRKENPEINKKELTQQIDKALIEFSNIDHLVLCYCNEEYDYFLIDDFVTLANAVKDHNSSLNKKVEIYYRNMKYQLLNNDVKGLSRRITKYKTIGRYNFEDGNEDIYSDE